MNRLAATIVLTVAGVFALAGAAPAQTSLQEHSLKDVPAASHAPAPAAPAASPQPGAATVAPAPTPIPVQGGSQPGGAPAPAPTSAVGQAAVTPPPPPAGAPAGGQPGYAPPPPPPPPAAGGTPINGQTMVTPPPPPPSPPPTKAQTYNRAEVNREVLGFFDKGSRGLAEMVARSFHDLGEPTGFIKGNEAGGALVVGLRYGKGTLYLKGQKPVTVFWQSPSLGFDLGVDAVRVFTLVYGTTNPNEIFQRFPGVDGSAYIIGGFGMNYQRSGNITLAPIRFGVGLRLGANIGYQTYTRTQDINPF